MVPCRHLDGAQPESAKVISKPQETLSSTPPSSLSKPSSRVLPRRRSNPVFFLFFHPFWRYARFSPAAYETSESPSGFIHGLIPGSFPDSAVIPRKLYFLLQVNHTYQSRPFIKTHPGYPNRCCLYKAPIFQPLTYGCGTSSAAHIKRRGGRAAPGSGSTEAEALGKR